MFNLKDCILKLDNDLDNYSKQTLMLTPRSELVAYNFGLGRYIRNECKLWADGTEKLEQDVYSLIESGYHIERVNELTEQKMKVDPMHCDCNLSHPDNMSGVIIELYHDYLNGRLSLKQLD